MSGHDWSSSDPISWRRRGLAVRLIVGLGFAVAATSWITVSAQQSPDAPAGTFPPDPFNGLQFEYSVAGAELGTPVDEPGYTWVRTYEGRLRPGSLVVAGTVHATNGWGAVLSVEVSADGVEPVRYSQRYFPEGGLYPNPWHHPFQVAIEVPAEARYGRFTIDVIGTYNAGNRGVSIQGNLDRDYVVPATATPSPTPTPAFDLTVGDVEITQVIQCMHSTVGAACADNSLPLVAGKRTAVRVFPVIDAEANNKPRNGEPVTARVKLMGQGSGLAPVNHAVLWNQPPEKNREWRDTTINFHLPPDWIRAGRITLEVTINPDRSLVETDYENNTKNVTIDFETRRKIKVRYFPVRVLDGNRKLSPDLAVARGGNQIMARWFPLPENGVSYYRGTRLTYYAPFPSLQPSPAYTDTDKLLAWFDRQTAISGLLGSSVDQYVAWIPMPAWAGAFWYGLSDPPWLNPPGRGKSVLIRTYSTASYGLAHEVAHNLGARHPNTNDACGAADPRTDWPYAKATIQETGYNFWNAGGVNVAPAELLDLMSYCDDSQKWMSPHTYRIAYDALAPRAGGVAASEAPGPVALISGTVYRDGRFELDPLVTVDSVAETAATGSGAYCIEFAGTSVERRCFDVDFLDHDQKPVSAETFQFLMTAPDGANRVELTHGGVVVAAIAASAHAPVVNIVEPWARAVWDGPRIVRWEATDADADDLTFTVLFSHDGVEWQTLNGDIETADLEVDFNELPGGGNVLLRILASDGFHTTEAEVEFAVPAKAPRPVIGSPVDGLVTTPGSLIEFAGSGDDPEDGDLDESTFLWSSDTDGHLGSGALITTAALSEGTHVIRLRARDSHGNVGEDSIQVLVRRIEVFLPLTSRHWQREGSTTRPTPVVEPTATRPSSGELVAEVQALVNDIRERNGLAPFARHDALVDAANWYAADMAENNYYDEQHYDRLDRDAAERLSALGYTRDGYVQWRVAENIAAGQGTAADVVESWMASAVHRANILSRELCETGIGHAFRATSDHGHYWVQDFGCRSAVVPTMPPSRTPSASPTPTRPSPTATVPTATAPTVTASPTPSATSLEPPTPTLTAPVPGTPTPLPLYMDDFSDPGSGWGILDEPLRTHRYVGGEYQIVLKSAQRTSASAPGFRCSDCIIEVDARLAEPPRGALGIVFGVSDTWDELQFLTSNGHFTVFKLLDGNWTEIVPWTAHAALRSGTATNRLRVERNGADIRLVANGQHLWSGWDFDLVGNLRVGVTATSFTDVPTDARFDNFVVYPPAPIR